MAENACDEIESKAELLVEEEAAVEEQSVEEAVEEQHMEEVEQVGEEEDEAQGKVQSDDQYATVLNDKTSGDVDESPTPKVLCLGACVLDTLAYVKQHLAPDTKVRTTQRLVHAGGGNAANTATALSRLGVPVSLITKVGKDATGEILLRELEDEGVDVSRVVQVDGMQNACSYVIVAEEEGSRTCIHTPATEAALPTLALTLKGP